MSDTTSATASEEKEAPPGPTSKCIEGSRQPLSAAEWEYVAEGRAHVVCRYVGQDTQYLHRVLRLPKRQKDSHGSEVRSERGYIRANILPVLSPNFVELGFDVPVSQSFISDLNISIAPYRPLGRVSDALDIACASVQCHADMTRYFPPISPDVVCEGPAVVVELKPKAGVVPRSYLVESAHRFKYICSRYELMQRYYWTMQRSKGCEPQWGRLHGMELEYSPLDLYSESRDRVKKALTARLRNPQNFVKIFVDSSVVYTHDKQDTSLKREATKLLLGGQLSEEEGNCSIGRLADLLALILMQEPLLGQLRALQETDLLDVEGASMVLTRLIDLCDGNEAEATRLIEEAQRTPLDLRALGAELQQCLAAPARAQGIANLGLEEAELDERRLRALTVVGGLEARQCAELLRRWLVALAACDCSIMISLRRLPPSWRKQEGATAGPRVQMRQGLGTPGISLEHGVAYHLQVIDVGPKPVAKIRSKAAIEPDVVRLAESVVIS